MHICSSWLYTWLPTSISRPARDKGKQISYQLIPKYIFFFLQYYFLVLIILLSLFFDIFLIKTGSGSYPKPTYCQTAIFIIRSSP